MFYIYYRQVTKCLLSDIFPSKDGLDFAIIIDVSMAVSDTIFNILSSDISSDAVYSHFDWLIQNSRAVAEFFSRIQLISEKNVVQSCLPELYVIFFSVEAC